MLKYIFSLLLVIKLLIQSTNSQSSDKLDISDYDYPKKEDDNDTFTVTILSTNDIHGTYFNTSNDILDKNEKYYIGGLEYLGRYITILREEWGNQFLWLDAGDQFQGGLESRLAEGDDITDFFGMMGLNASAIGNHEWDFGQAYLKKRLTNAQKFGFPYLSANLFDLKGKPEFLPNVITSKIFEINENVSIGVIGLTTVLTVETTSGDLSGVQFGEYIKVLVEESKKLREQNVKAIIALCHVGAVCTKEDSEDHMKLKMRTVKDSYTEKNCGIADELVQMLKKLPKGTIDAVIGGHKHEVNHHWIYGVPIMSNDKNGRFASVLYLKFDKNNDYKLINDQITIESPLPVCQKVFENIRRCDSMSTPEEFEKAGKITEYTFHGKDMFAEPKLKNISETYWKEYEIYTKTVLTRTNSTWSQKKNKEANLGNLYCDFLRQFTETEISVINAGTFKQILSPGEITAASIYAVNPFDNEIVKFWIYGRDLRRMVYEIQEGVYSFYPTAGLRQVATNNPKNKLLEVKLFDGVNESEIVDDKLYSISSNSFLVPTVEGVKGGDDFRRILEWMKPINVTSKGDLREKMTEYLKTIKDLDEKKYYNPTVNPRIRIIENNNIVKPNVKKKYPKYLFTISLTSKTKGKFLKSKRILNSKVFKKIKMKWSKRLKFLEDKF